MVIVFERASTSTRKFSALYQAVVSKTVVDDQIAGPNKVTNHRFVTSMTSGKGNDILDTKELRQFAFQFSVDRLFARDDSAGRHAGTKVADRIHCTLVNVRMPRQAKVIITCERDQFLAIDPRRVADAAFVNGKERIANPSGLNLVLQCTKPQELRHLLQFVVGIRNWPFNAGRLFRARR